MKIETLYDIGDKVTIDGCNSVVAVILAVVIRGKNTSYQVSYWGNGSLQEPYVEEWRLTPWAE